MTTLLALAGAILMTSCAAHKETVSTGSGWVAKQVKKLDGFEDHQWGFALYDPNAKNWVYRRNADQYFTPASNTKILTYYASLKHLGDTTVALRFVEDGDTLTFWGTGDPSLMYTVPDSNLAVEFLRNHPASVLRYAPKGGVDKYGPGWAWDDYAYRFQVERSTLPVYGNRITFRKLALELEGTVEPYYFRDYVVEDPVQPVFASRLPEANAFSINTALITEIPFERSIPFIVSDYDIAEILSDLTTRKIDLEYSFIHPSESNTLPGSPTDSLYKLLMQDSDNFVAEQLMIQVADAEDLPLDVDTVIQIMCEDFFEEAPQPFQWYDGSGLSRYNLFTPESLVWLLEKLRMEHDMSYLKKIFPAGGVSGTIDNVYELPGAPPYVFAKTGTLRNKHSLSGYLITKEGKTLTFSFMHNNFIGSSGVVKREMEQLLRAIYEKY